MLHQVIQVCGSLLILLGFALAQYNVWSPQSRLYLTANMVGSGILSAEAVIGRQWGFLLLEGTWALLSAYGLFRIFAGSPLVRSNPAVRAEE